MLGVEKPLKGKSLEAHGSFAHRVPQSDFSEGEVRGREREEEGEEKSGADEIEGSLWERGQDLSRRGGGLKTMYPLSGEGVDSMGLGKRRELGEVVEGFGFGVRRVERSWEEELGFGSGFVG